MTPDEARLWALMKDRKGEANAIKQAAAAELLGFGDTRTVQIVLRALRVEHRKRIASSGHGMFIPATDAEEAAFKAQIRGRAAENLVLLQAWDASEAMEVVRELNFGSDEHADAEAQSPVQAPPRSVHGASGAPVDESADPYEDDDNVGPIVYDENGQPRRCWCTAVIRGDKRKRHCSEFHRQVFHGRKKVAS